MEARQNPSCPNHHVSLESCQSLGKGRGTGICPISGCRFDYDEDYFEKTKKLKRKVVNGEIKEVWEGDWKLEGPEGG